YKLNILKYMEIEEKRGSCEGKGKCDHGMGNCCHNWKKCHMMRRIIMIIAIIIAFCLGTQWGEMKGEFRNGNRFERGGMMNWSYNNSNKDQIKSPLKATGSVTVDVKAPVAAPTPAQ
ncbi:MAG: hypothetical protein NTV03_03075, partial [Candidatus Nomurabacteria bacterium]|nr:hypothetical protein [Candidatus Nomurabacteria bacterium]